MTDRELMQQALEALENCLRWPDVEAAITALRERLSQPETVMAEYKHQTYAAYKVDGEMKIGVVPEQEPVAHLWQHSETGRTRIVMPDQIVTADANWLVVGPLYLTPPRREWQGLTLDEFDAIHERCETMAEAMVETVRKLKEKNA